MPGVGKYYAGFQYKGGYTPIAQLLGFSDGMPGVQQESPHCGAFRFKAVFKRFDAI